MDDFDRWTAWRDGDAELGAALFERHYRGIFQFVRRRVGDAAEDVAQQVFVTCLEVQMPSPRPPSVRAWLFGIARKLALQHFDRIGRGGGPRGAARSVYPTPLTPGTVIARREEARVLLEALRHISIDQQIVIELMYWEELTQAEVATALEIPEGTVKSRLSRAKAALRQHMQRASVSRAIERSTMDNLGQWARRVHEAVTEG